MNIEAGSTLREVAFMVCTELDEIGVVAVLTGGSAATIYAPEAYQSRDLDFIIQFHAEGAASEAVLEELGYRREGQVYVHAQNPLTLDFPPGPLAVGDERICKWSTLQDGRQILHVLLPTDSCRDRLAGYLFWNDLGSLDQALAVARAQAERVDLQVIRKWCRREGEAARFEDFMRQLKP